MSVTISVGVVLWYSSVQEVEMSMSQIKSVDVAHESQGMLDYWVVNVF